MSSLRDRLVDALRMNGGDGEHSYANNSLIQKNLVCKTQLLVEESINDMLLELGFLECIKVADLGSSSGQNTFLAMSKIVNTIIESYQLKGQNSPGIDCCLNDLTKNDFNTTFKLIPSFYEKLNMDVKGKCFVSGTPGSFYSRLFPINSLHFAHSSYSIHWLSKVPEGIEDNKKNVYPGSPCLANLYKSYLNQFQKDFSLFLRMRSEEIVSNGRMILTFLGREASDPLSKDCFGNWSLISDSLFDLVSEGFVNELDVESFNLPFYNPDEGEVREIVAKEGSFEINKFGTFKFPTPHEKGCVEEGDYSDQSRLENSKNFANSLRSVTEAMLAGHFGDAIIDRLFNKLTHRVADISSNYFNTKTAECFVSLTRK
ncbi:hypothetical protein EUTSA_v10010465mg [Eutrema salsugineum]|uniref:Uncharacterized protein n=1 Tax=Eutrema salsugineum TaxID=72664 RepID=V4L518_EUTSA|nr:salicylate/benzoate carboxyl methyltransferase [Eutrema salsugineum]ESQ45430.1 hypothetical protein EUTSA_v10010465mg [Eutrema salsugineum]